MLLVLVFLDQYMKVTLTQIIQQMSYKPDGKLKNMYFVQEEAKSFQHLHTIGGFVERSVSLS